MPNDFSVAKSHHVGRPHGRFDPAALSHPGDDLAVAGPRFTLAAEMSQENVEALTLGFEALNSGDLERILAFVHPDFEAVVSPEFSAEPDTYRGFDGVRRYFASFQDAMEQIRFEADRVWDAGDSVVVEVRLTARGRETGIPVEQRIAQVWEIRDGKATRVRTYASLSEALEAAGLTEPSA
jgi:ketosteroid isomerase-like protein